MDYIAQPKDYWIAQQAIDITLNALDNPNRINGTLLTGAAILCYIEGVEGLDYDAGHHFKTWPLTFSPTRFNNNNVKYVYVAIPRTEQIGTQAVVVFPEEQLDVYGMNASDEQVGSADYYYIWLQGVISDTDGTTPRTWSQQVDFGKKGTDEDLYDFSETDWYIYSKVTNTVTFLKKIVMQAGSYFQNIFLGSRELTGVATGATTAEYVDSEVLVATPSYIKANYLSKKSEDQAQEQIGFLKGLWVKAQNLFGIDANGNAKVNELEAAGSALFHSLVSILGLLEAKLGIKTTDIVSDDYTGDDAFDKGWGIFKHKDASHPHSYAVIDELFVRIKAVFNELEVRKMSFSGGDQVFSHAGGKVVMVRTLYAPTDGVLSLDNATYDESRQMLILHGAIYSAEDERIILAQDEVDMEGWIPVAYRCYFTKDDGTMATRNWWAEDDLAWWKQTGIQEPGVYHDYQTREGHRLVSEVGSELVTVGEGDDATEVMYDYIDLSIEAEGEGEPQAGDHLVQMGNLNDTERQDFIMLDITSQDSPALKMYEGVHSYVLPEPTQQISRRDTHMAFNKLFIRTDYGTFQQPVERGNWTDIPLDDDNHRRCYYYDVVQHNGATWKCVTLSETGYTIDEPSSNSPNWRVYAAKGEKGDKGDTGATGATGPQGPAGQDGAPGVDGDDALDIMLTPSNCIIPQAQTKNQQGEYPLDYNNAFCEVHVMLGDTELIAGLQYTVSVKTNMQDTNQHCDGEVDAQQVNKVKITEVKTYTQDNKSYFYDRGYLTVIVTYRGTTYERKFAFACNLLGTWTETIEGDVQTIVAEKINYLYDPDNPNQVVKNSTYATYVQSSSESISKLTSQMNNGKNLLTGVLTGTGWKSASSTTPSTLHDITVDSDGWFNAYGTDSYMISPAFRIDNGQKYVFSYYQGAIGNNYVYVKYYDSANSQWVQFARVYTTGSDLRKSITFTGTSEVVGKDLYIFIYRKPITRPQLEFGEVATAFDAGTTETTSEMKQTASEINLSVRGDVAGTNINLLYGVDGYTSSNKLVHKMKAGDGAIEYGGDNDHPHIFTSVQLVKGCTYTIQCVTDGNIASSHGSSGTPSSKLCTIWLRMDGTLNGGYNGECFTSQYSGYENLGNGRHKWTFVCKKTGEYWFRTNSYSDGTTEVTINFWNIKLEGGSDATAFTASTSQMASQINQTANSIEMNVKNGLEEVGISILGDSNKVVAKAGTFEVQNNSGTKTFEIDSDGNLQGRGNAAFKGTIKSGQYTESGQTKYANQINADGSGQLAKGGISWDANGNSEFSGEMKSPMVYSPNYLPLGTVIVGTDVKARTFIKAGNSSSATVMLPNPVDYEGLEVQFFAPITTRIPMGDLIVKSQYSLLVPDSDNIYDNCPYGVKVNINNLVTFKAIGQDWFLMSGSVEVLTS